MLVILRSSRSGRLLSTQHWSAASGGTGGPLALARPLSPPDVSVPEADVVEDCATGNDLFYLQHLKKNGPPPRLSYPKCSAAEPNRDSSTSVPRLQPCALWSSVTTEAGSTLCQRWPATDSIRVAVKSSVLCLIKIMYFNCVRSHLWDSKWKISSWLILAF